MRALFRKIDGILSLVKTLVVIYLVLSVIGVITGSIILFFNRVFVNGLICLIVGLFAIFISWLFWRLLFSLFDNVRIVRNKLYNVSVSDIASQYGVSVTEGPSVTYITGGNYNNYR